MKKLDYLLIGAHPDDCEIFAGGTILSLKAQGAKVGVLDLTQGEKGTFGTVAIRRREWEAAAKLLKLDYRATLDCPDSQLGDPRVANEAREQLIPLLRALQPEVLFTFPEQCRHPDHTAVHHIVRQAAFLAGLRPSEAQATETRHRSCALIEFIEFYPPPRPSFVIDVSEHYERKKEVVKCFKTQVLVDEQQEVAPAHTTFIRSSAFWDNFNGRLLWFGSMIGVRYGEGFTTAQVLRVADPIWHFKRRFR